MSKIITSEILVAYSLCLRKAFLMLCTETHGTPHEYVKILELQRQDSRCKYLDILQNKHPDVQPYSPKALKDGSDFLINASLEANGLTADCAFLTKVKTPSTLGSYSYEPTIFAGTHSIKEEQNLELFFVGYVLNQIQNKLPASGRIIGLNERSHNVDLENSTKKLLPLIEPLQEWVEISSPEPPALILNKHCSICQFQRLCHAKAEQEDNLSLLDGISTRKAINKYEKKGIFTIKQLSYIFKPRKHKKRTKHPPPAIHRPELQALAIREGKIYLQEMPEVSQQTVELFLDIEGIPDQQFYYLIGLLICEGDVSTYYHFWANTPKEETQIWMQFLEKVNQYPNAPIYHYGSYDARAVAKLTERYETNDKSLNNRLTNVNRYIYGRIYFPVYSNRLKKIGDFIGATWTSTEASGVQALVWRYHWEKTCNARYQNLLLIYNREDCQALKLLTNELAKIKNSAHILSQIDFADQPKRHTTQIGEQIHGQFEMMLRFAHANYDKKKISFRQHDDEPQEARKIQVYSKGHQGQRKERHQPTKIIQVPQRETCPNCGTPLQPTERVSRRLITDLILIREGITKVTIQYEGLYGYCSKCYKKYSPPGISKYRVNQVFGEGFMAWFVYHRVALRLPYETIAQLAEEQFDEKITLKNGIDFIKNTAIDYLETEKIITRRLLESPFIHVDETQISIQGVTQYVWVFTDGNYVIFKLTETREATIVHELLANFDGILISDFYPGYDSVRCTQQKCWVHLIRDLNDDLYEAPFDTEFGTFILEVRNLIIPIMENVHKYGLKTQYLNQFTEQVENFYETVIIGKNYRSELATKYQNRFIRYRNSLFTFLKQDGIPWHNNTAERAIRHLAKQRLISGTFHEIVTHLYLILLEIRQTCRFQGKSFFKFLFSGEKDIDKFEVMVHNNTRQNPGAEQGQANSGL